MISDLFQKLKEIVEFVVDSRKIDEEAEIPKQTLKALAEMGLFGQQVDTDFGKFFYKIF